MGAKSAVKELTGPELKLYLLICDLTSPEQVTNEELAKLAKITVRSVQYKVKILKEKGFIAKAKNNVGFKVL